MSNSDKPEEKTPNQRLLDEAVADAHDAHEEQLIAQELIEARKRRIKALGEMMQDTQLEIIRVAQTELGTRLGILEQRFATLVENMIDVMASDQEHDEKLHDFKEQIVEHNRLLKRLLTLVEGKE